MQFKPLDTCWLTARGQVNGPSFKQIATEFQKKQNKQQKTNKHSSTSSRIAPSTQVVLGYHTGFHSHHGWSIKLLMPGKQYREQTVTNSLTWLPSMVVPKCLNCHVPTIKAGFLLSPSLKERLGIFLSSSMFCMVIGYMFSLIYEIIRLQV